MFVCDNTSEEDDQNRNMFGKISAQPHPTLCIQFLDRENNDKNNTLPLGKQICFTVWRCAEILPTIWVTTQKSVLLSELKYVWAMT